MGFRHIVDYTVFFNPLLRGTFCFHIDETLCILLGNKVFAVRYLPDHIEIEEFNQYFLPKLNLIKERAKEKEKHYSTHEYIPERPVEKRVRLKVIER